MGGICDLSVANVGEAVSRVDRNSLVVDSVGDLSVSVEVDCHCVDELYVGAASRGDGVVDDHVVVPEVRVHSHSISRELLDVWVDPESSIS